MTPIDGYVVGAALLFSAGQILLGLRATWVGRNYRRLAKYERIRGQFGQARNELVWLVASGSLADDSQTFKQLYAVQTTMMRRCDTYPAISHAIWRNVIDGKHSKIENKLHRETPHWDADTVRVVKLTADALRQVWWGCMPFATIVNVSVDLGRKTLAFVGSTAVQSVDQFISGIVFRIMPGLREVRELEQVLRRQIAA